MLIPNLAHALQTRIQEGDDLLARLIEQLQQDDRVVAAALHGSLARDRLQLQPRADALSDIDLRVVVDDAHIEEICGDTHSYVAQVDEPLLRHNAPRNAPRGGAYLLVLYPGQFGPHHVDWTWQPRREAYLYADSVALFDRAGLHKTTQPLINADPPPPAQCNMDDVRRAWGKLSFFWAMTPVIAKKIARNHGHEIAFLFEDITWKLHEIRALLGLSPLPARDGDGVQTKFANATQPDQLTDLRDAVHRAHSLTQPVLEAGGSVPQPAIPYIERFLNLVETILEESAPVD